MTIVVLIPFNLSKSPDHELWLSTAGGLTAEGKAAKTTIEKAVALADENLSKARAMHSENETLKKPQPPRLINAITELETNLAENRSKLRDQLVPIRGWNGVTPENIVFADSPNLSRLLGSLKQGTDQLYVRGHCSKGTDYLASESDGGLEITVTELVKLLDGKLSKKYTGRIKLFGCETALADNENPSFAQKFAEAMSKGGWVNLQVVGYKNVMLTFIRRTDNPDGLKFAQDGTAAKDCRLEFQVRSSGGCAIQ